MPKTYLRYALDRCVGVIASPAANIAVDRAGVYMCTGALEDVAIWNAKSGRQVRAAIVCHSRA
jgi:hypothetical protein